MKGGGVADQGEDWEGEVGKGEGGERGRWGVGPGGGGGGEWKLIEHKPIGIRTPGGYCFYRGEGRPQEKLILSAKEPRGKLIQPENEEPPIKKEKKENQSTVYEKTPASTSGETDPSRPKTPTKTQQRGPTGITLD